jgi:hypothetical protein
VAGLQARQGSTHSAAFRLAGRFDDMLFPRIVEIRETRPEGPLPPDLEAAADAGYFAANCGRTVAADEARAIEAALLAACRWQYIHSGARHPRFGKVLTGLITESQGQRIQAALATLH